MHAGWRRSGGADTDLLPRILLFDRQLSFGVANHTDMETHALPQAVIFELAKQHGVETRLVMEDGFLGAQHVWVSNTFVWPRRAKRATASLTFGSGWRDPVEQLRKIGSGSARGQDHLHLAAFELGYCSIFAKVSVSF